MKSYMLTKLKYMSKNVKILKKYARDVIIIFMFFILNSMIV